MYQKKCSRPEWVEPGPFVARPSRSITCVGLDYLMFRSDTANFNFTVKDRDLEYFTTD